MSHTVAAGDTCSKIWTSAGISEADFRAQNPNVDCNKIQVGDKLCIAPSTATVSSSSATATSSGTPSSCDNTYTVVQGDSCYKIWNTAKLTEAAFKSVNPSIDCTNLTVGSKVCISAPGGSGGPTYNAPGSSSFVGIMPPPAPPAGYQPPVKVPNAPNNAMPLYNAAQYSYNMAPPVKVNYVPSIVFTANDTVSTTSNSSFVPPRLYQLACQCEPSPQELELATNHCDSALHVPGIKDLAPDVLDHYKETCISDIITTGSYAFTEASRQALNRHASSLVNSFIASGSSKLQVVGHLANSKAGFGFNTCINDCSGNGACGQIGCICNAPFTGSDCSLNQAVLPSVLGKRGQSVTLVTHSYAQVSKLLTAGSYGGRRSFASVNNGASDGDSKSKIDKAKPVWSGTSVKTAPITIMSLMAIIIPFGLL